MTSQASSESGPGLGAPSEGFFRSEYLDVALILVLFLLSGFLYSVVTPIFEASDELWHYPFVKRLADGDGLPVQHPDDVGPWRQEGSQPPLYYALGALLTKGIDTSDAEVVRRINPHADIGVITRDRNVNMVVHTPRERFPYRGATLAVHVVRWASVIMGGVTVIAAWLLAREVFPQDRVLAASAACLTGLNAMFLFITASVNNDALVNMICALCLWLLVKYVAMPPSAAGWTLLGVLLGVGSLSKLSALGLFPFAGLVVLLVAWRHRSWKDLARGVALIGLPVLLLGGWWYYRNWRLYRDLLGLSTFISITGKRYPVPTPLQLLAEWRGFVMSYWGFFGGMNVPAPGWLYLMLSLLGLVGLMAAPVYIWRSWRVHGVSRQRWLQLGLIALWPCALFASLVRWTLMTPASQGRLLFPGLTAISLMMVMGLAAAMPRRWRALLPGAVCGVTLVTSLSLPFTTICPAYAPPDLLTEQEVNALSRRLGTTFGGMVRLLGYEVEEGEVAPGDHVTVTLNWESLAQMREDYSVFVHLVAANDLIIGQRDMYPGQGNYPTTLWKPGDRIADTYVVSVSPTALTPAEAEVRVGLYSLSTGARLGATDAAGNNLGDSISFGRILLPERRAGGIPNPTYVSLDDRIALIGYELDRTAAAPREAFRLTLYWRALRDIGDNYSVFTHVLGEGDHIWAQMDGWPQQGESPTASWTKGQIVEDPYELVVHDDAPPGVYDLEVGMYAADGKRLGVLGEGGHVQDTRILLGRVRILAAP